MALGLQHIYFNLSKIYAIIYIGNPISESMKGENRMYLTVKQQVKHLSKEDYITIRELCHTAKYSGSVV